MPNAQQSYEKLLQSLKEIAVLRSGIALLGWDERVNLPPKGSDARAEQMAVLARLDHERFTSPAIDELLSDVESSDLVKDDSSDTAVNVRWTRRAFDRQKKLPASLVEELAKVSSLGETAWVDARKRSDFKTFQPWLSKQIDLKRQQATCYGFTEHMYDALLEDYEPFATTKQVKTIFDDFRPKLVTLIQKVKQSGKKAPIEILERKYPLPQQETFGRAAAGAMGFDFNAGRLDVSVHPFCSGIAPGDTRMTTRYDEHDLGNCLYSVMHEAGHGMYEQGLDPAHWGTPRGTAVSLGIHESQSRMWENLVGRSKSFWKYMMPKARETFPDSLRDVNDDAFVWAVNDISPTLIRTESDEATYNLHIMLRFDLEQQMLTGELKPSDVPAEWNRRMKADLGVDVPNDAKGCLQDTHWAAGLFGYFPTYSLGNMYAAQFFEKARKDLGDLDAMFAKGEFAPLLTWLQKNIHRQGMKYAPRELVKHVTGSDLSSDALLRHLSKKVEEYYG